MKNYFSNDFPFTLCLFILELLMYSHATFEIFLTDHNDNSQEHRSISRFIGYALCAADEALKDAKWLPSEQEQKERTVSSIHMQIIHDNFFSYH